ncbi:hypothetical protein ACQP1U_05865 [Actinomycetota bacterium]
MATLISRILGTLLVLAGVALVIPGAWLWSHIGSEGVATFATDPKAATVVLTPDTINRVDRPIEVRATGPGEIWLAKGDPSDAKAAVGDTKRVVPNGVDVRDWVLTTRTEGTSTDRPATAELWTEQATRDREITTTVDQAEAPQTIVISSTDGTPLTGLSYTVRDADWFRWALWPVIAGAGLILLGLGLWLWSLLRRRRSRRADEAPVATTDELDMPVAVGGATAATAATQVESDPDTEPMQTDDLHSDEVHSDHVHSGDAHTDGVHSGDVRTDGEHPAYPVEHDSPEQTEVIVTDHDRSDEGGHR